MLEILPQVIWYALLASAIYALVSIGLTLIFGVLEFIHFAHGDMAMVGAYMLLAFWPMLGLPYWIAFMFVVFIAAFFGFVMERLAFKSVRRSHPFKPLIISIGISVLLQSLVIIFFGGGVNSYRQSGGAPAKTFEFLNGDLVVTDHQILLMVITAILLIAVGLFLKYSRTGKAMRAVADNRDVAAILGIDVDKIISIIFALGTALAAAAGMLIGAEQNLSPTMGIELSVKAFAAIVLGGLGNVTGAVVGALIIGFMENFIVGFTPIPQSFKEAIVFSFLIIMLFLRPNGILGASMEAEVRK